MTDSVWILDDDPAIRWVLEELLQSSKIPHRSFSEPKALLGALQTTIPSVVITDIRMPEMDGLSLLKQLQLDHPELPIVVITAYSDLQSSVDAYQQGAFEYLAKPFDLDEALAVIQKALQHQTMAVGSQINQVHSPTQLIGQSPAMQQLFRSIGRLSRRSVSVLITGPSGSGKELVARALHQHSPRVNGPFIALNMAAVPQELIESELFGHEKGSFTGALSHRAGRFEQASGGTLFLDEIGDMPLTTQTRLLRVLADGHYYRVGGQSLHQSDVRIIAATHQPLLQRVQEGYFREDLFHRLNVIHLEIPPLSERSQDISTLAQHFLQRFALEHMDTTKTLLPDTITLLESYPWPGNVRQLENLCHYLCVMVSHPLISVNDLPAEYRQRRDHSPNDWQQMLCDWAKLRVANGHRLPVADIEAQIEQRLLDIALQACGGHKQQAAELLGWGRNTLTRKLQQFSASPLDTHSEHDQDTP